VLAGAIALGAIVSSLAFDRDEAFESSDESLVPAEPPASASTFRLARVSIPRSRLSVPRPQDVPVVRDSGEASDTSAVVTLTSRVPATVTVTFSPGFASAEIPPSGTRQVGLPPGCYRMTYRAAGYATASDRECLSAGQVTIEFYLVRRFGFAP
jgi:hypothetical protein